jgi:hypothetical protein
MDVLFEVSPTNFFKHAFAQDVYYERGVCPLTQLAVQEAPRIPGWETDEDDHHFPGFLLGRLLSGAYRC